MDVSLECLKVCLNTHEQRFIQISMTSLYTDDHRRILISSIHQQISSDSYNKPTWSTKLPSQTNINLKYQHKLHWSER